MSEFRPRFTECQSHQIANIEEQVQIQFLPDPLGVNGHFGQKGESKVSFKY